MALETFIRLLCMKNMSFSNSFTGTVQQLKEKHMRSVAFQGSHLFPIAFLHPFILIEMIDP